MSQVNKKIIWCLNKAEKELKEKGLHRGLVKTKVDFELAKKHLLKAQHNLKAAISFEQSEFSDWSASAFFYSIYHCFLAIARHFGYESRNQECTIALMETLKEEGKIILDQELIDTLKITDSEDLHTNSVISLRETFQYSIKLEFKEDEKFNQLMIFCKKAIDQTTKILTK